MAHFLVEYREVGNPEMRERLRGEHIAYRKGLGGTIALAGPLLDGADRPVGSVVIIEAPDEAAADEIAKGDPYVAAELMECASVRKYRIAVINPPQG